MSKAESCRERAVAFRFTTHRPVRQGIGYPEVEKEVVLGGE